jgi:hypothetical protein
LYVHVMGRKAAAKELDQRASRNSQ